MATPSSRRVRAVAATALIATAVAGAVGSCGPLRENERAQYCAIMPDSVGLYAGNPVTHLGYRIGTVTTITPGIMSVRVDFTVPKHRRLPSDVKAIIRSTSILADRTLELAGNAEPGPPLPVGKCIPLSRSFTPKSLSETIGSATDFINSINPDGSTNVGGTIRGIDQAIHNKGAGINQLLTTASAVLESPDRAVADIGSIITNLAQLTSLVTELRGPLKEILLDVQKTTPDAVKALQRGPDVLGGFLVIIRAVADIEVSLGMETQFALDATSMALRKLSAHAPRLANLLNPVPWWINSIANIANTHGLNFLRYRPPLYRVRTPDGVARCNIMNARAPGTCANVQGTPYAVDVALLQYVLSEASHQ